MKASVQVERAKDLSSKYFILLVTLSLVFISVFLLDNVIQTEKNPLSEMYSNCYGDSGSSTNTPPNPSLCSFLIESIGYYSKDDLSTKIDQLTLFGHLCTLLLIIILGSLIYVYRLQTANKSVIYAFEKAKFREIKIEEAKTLEKEMNYLSAIRIYRQLDEKDEIIRIDILRAGEFEASSNYRAALKIWENLGKKENIIRIKTILAEQYEKEEKYVNAIQIWTELGNRAEIKRISKIKSEKLINEAKEREKTLSFEDSINMWEKMGREDYNINSGLEIRRLKTLEAQRYENNSNDEDAIRLWGELGNRKQILQIKSRQAKEFEKDLDYDGALGIWKEIGNDSEISRINRIKIEKRIIKAKEFEENMDYDNAITIWQRLGEREQVIRLKTLKAKNYEDSLKLDDAINMWRSIGYKDEVARIKRQQKINYAREREEAADYDSAVTIWEELGDRKNAARVRKEKANLHTPNISQHVVHGDYVDDRDTIIKDSVVSKSNLSNEDPISKLKQMKEMLSEGLIDDDEFKQMKKELLGK